jgi:hypothetical protein
MGILAPPHSIFSFRMPTMISFPLAVVKALGRVALVLGLIALSSCEKSERNVILDKAPFYHTTLPYSVGRADRVVETVRAFSQEQGMDFLVAQKSLEPGNFNASANGKDLNLSAIYVSSISPGVQVFAIAKNEPSQRDMALSKEFARRVRKAAR